METRGRIVVRSGNIMRPPLLVSEDAAFVEIYDTFGALMALLIRIKDDIWSLSTKGDPDWADTLVRHGFMKPTGSIENIIRSGLTGGEGG